MCVKLTVAAVLECKCIKSEIYITTKLTEAAAIEKMWGVKVKLT